MTNNSGSRDDYKTYNNSVQQNLSKSTRPQFRIGDEVITLGACERWRYPPVELIPAGTRGRLVGLQTMLFQIGHEIWLVQFTSGALSYLSTENFELADTLDRITREIFDEAV